ncbi:putative metal-dependent phosphoesterase (PHP family) [Rubidibacter lacunae KORDI 51-2]|uniref:Putative metal-dependent phosphoesterase (PHP family) n=1 Tax=Rubidibacter lacunae KORDI 51-2 TaxID=582515 RepID=U5DU17_9CHRO|nr:PHP domain-containing protein [Rubidibacter lacunae]ERN43175.1 putative metal-dependent phosphoesterase (PHP family) [Rubidibacter lacunae KORDI 51-2]
MLELHCHTTFSDGTLAPTELVEAAAAAGVRALAITDHDTLGGWDEAIAAARRFGLTIVPGIELSTVWHGRSLHVLGFYPQRDLLEPPLRDRFEGRRRRARQMADKLAKLGYPIVLPQIGAGIAPGRPHIARALVAAGHARTEREAFDRWLSDGGPAYVSYEKFSAVEGIRLLRDCGAVPVWAHPFLFRGGEPSEILPELVAAGLRGIEIYHPTHTPTQHAMLAQLARTYNLVATGGSDYHGPIKDGPTLNQLQLPLELLTALQAARLTNRGPASSSDRERSGLR